MGELRAADLDGALDLIRSASGASSLGGFRLRVAAGVRRLVPADHASYDELDLVSQVGQQVDDPPGVVDFDIDWALRTFLDDHPLVLHVLRSRHHGPIQDGDLPSRRAWRSSFVYDQCMRPTGREHQMLVSLHDPQPLLTAVAVNRARGGFDERERELLSLLRPHLTQARADVQMREMLAALGEQSSVGVVVLTKSLRIAALDRRARSLLRTYFGADAGRGGSLPDELDAWARAESIRLEPGAVKPASPQQLVRVGREARLAARLLPAAGSADSPRIVLDERRRALDPERLAASQLTPRETEVLGLVARGLIDVAIARELGVSPRTVHKHVTRVLAKLGVGTRTAAVARGLELSSEAQPPEASAR